MYLTLEMFVTFEIKREKKVIHTQKCVCKMIESNNNNNEKNVANPPTIQSITQSVFRRGLIARNHFTYITNGTRVYLYLNTIYTMIFDTHTHTSHTYTLYLCIIQKQNHSMCKKKKKNPSRCGLPFMVDPDFTAETSFIHLVWHPSYILVYACCHAG